jgi:hypothetical protein
MTRQEIERLPAGDGDGRDQNDASPRVIDLQAEPLSAGAVAKFEWDRQRKWRLEDFRGRTRARCPRPDGRARLYRLAAQEEGELQAAR